LDYIEKNAPHPGPIDNRALWHLIFNNKEVQRKRDYYIVEKNIWNFLHGIYNGGPILHKDKKEVNSETVSVRSSTTSLGASIGNIIFEKYNPSSICGNMNHHEHNIIAEEDHEEEKYKIKTIKEESEEIKENKESKIIKPENSLNHINIVQKEGEIEEFSDEEDLEEEEFEDEGEYEEEESEVSDFND